MKIALDESCKILSSKTQVQKREEKMKPLAGRNFREERSFANCKI